MPENRTGAAPTGPKSAPRRPRSQSGRDPGLESGVESRPVFSLVRQYRSDLGRAQPAAKAYLAGSALMGVGMAVTWSLLARHLEARGFDKVQVGNLLAAESMGKLLVALPAALVLARRSARGLFMGSAFVGGASYLAIPMIQDPRLLAVACMLAGMALTVHYVAIAPFLLRHTGERERAGIFGLAEALRAGFAMLGGFGGGRLVQVVQDRIAAEGASAQVRNAAEATATGYAIACAGLFAWLAILLYARIGEDRPSLSKREPILPILRKHRGLFGRFLAPQLLIAVGSGLCIPFLPLYFKDRFGLEPGAWGNLFALGQLGMCFGMLLTPWFLARLGFVRSMVGIELCSIPFFLVLAFAGSPWLAAGAYLARGALMNATHPLHKNLMMQVTPPGAREVQTGLNALLWGLGWVVGPKVGGHVLAATGNRYELLMLATVVLYLGAAVLSWRLLLPLERRLLEAAKAEGGVEHA